MILNLHSELSVLLKGAKDSLSKDTSDIISSAIDNPSDANDQKLIKHLTEESVKGKAAETFALALIHHRGDFKNSTIPKKDDNEIVQLYKKAADNNHQYARCRLADAYQFGELGLEKNDEKARKLYEAAEKNKGLA